MALARHLMQPTRTAGLTSALRRYRLRERPADAVPIRSCSRWGLPCRFRCRTRGALLPHLFTLAADLLAEFGAVRFLWHFPWGRPRRTLSGTACRWSPDFPPPRPFDHCGSGRPADWRPAYGRSGASRQVSELAAIRSKINYPEDVVLDLARSTGCRRSSRGL